MVLLTKDEEANLPETLAALLRQTLRDHEVVVVDAGSTDRTEAIAREHAARDARVRFVQGGKGLGFGAARNLGLAESRAPLVAFVSADAVPDDDWLELLADAMVDADAAFGKQVHAPSRLNASTVSRGLRYHIFEREPPMSPVAYASNVNAMWRRELLAKLPFDERLPASEDADLARRAQAAGARLVYAPSARVRHKDVASSRAEWRKVRREGRANGALARSGEVDGSLLLWGGAVLGSLVAAALLPGLVAAAVAGAFLWAPTARRLLVLRPRQYPAGALVTGVLVTPAYDLGYLSGYLQGLARP